MALKKHFSPAAAPPMTTFWTALESLTCKMFAKKNLICRSAPSAKGHPQNYTSPRRRFEAQATGPKSNLEKNLKLFTLISGSLLNKCQSKGPPQELGSRMLHKRLSLGASYNPYSKKLASFAGFPFQPAKGGPPVFRVDPKTEAAQWWF